jgi:hypothetical protein
LVLSSPLLILASLLILIFDKGPIFFTQERHGFMGKIFLIYKLRTWDVDNSGNLISTKTGHILRKIRLNEIPQFYNVIRGDWSRIQQLKGEISPTDSAKKVFKILPVGLTTKFNSHSPYGWNDGGMIMAKGLQTMVSAGVYAKWGPLSIQLQPELYYAANPSYTTTTGYGFNSGKSFQKIYFGQSAIKLNLGPISLGLSSQNNWWGPGQFSSIMMSNNAPGFNHFSINTSKPIKTPIGSIEFQLVMGRLK